MLLATLAFEKERDSVMRDIGSLRELYKDYNQVIGYCETMEGNTHFVKIFCDDSMESRLVKKADLYLADILYKVAADEFVRNYMEPILSESYFFLRYDELKELENQCLCVLKGNERHITENNICCYNRRSHMLEKIKKLMKENREVNIDGFITFRMKELNNDFTYILNRIVEGYIVEREYDEFISLLRYFVELQEPKIEEVNIIIDEMGEYYYRDNKNKDIKAYLTGELFDFKQGVADDDDMLIGALISNPPQKIIIHCVENAINEEIIDTIIKVFSDRVELCSSCRMCKRKKSRTKTANPKRK